MTRISKEPEERKQEIIETAMKLFAVKGYDETSMADIAKTINVVPGLCYRYFKSKSEIYEEGMKGEISKLCKSIVYILQDNSKSIELRIESMMDYIINNTYKENQIRFHSKISDNMFTIQFYVKVCEYLLPYLEEMINEYYEIIGINIDNSYISATSILYGSIGILNDSTLSIEEKIILSKKLIQRNLLQKTI